MPHKEGLITVGLGLTEENCEYLEQIISDPRGEFRRFSRSEVVNRLLEEHRDLHQAKEDSEQEAA